MRRQYLLIVPADLVTKAKAVAATIDPGGGADFSHGLSPDGSEPFTHFAACWSLTDAQIDTISGNPLLVGLQKSKYAFNLRDKSIDDAQETFEDVKSRLGLMSPQSFQKWKGKEP